MVKTMESSSYQQENFNELASDFSVISHPSEEQQQQIGTSTSERNNPLLLPNGNLEHLQHLHFPSPPQILGEHVSTSSSSSLLSSSGENQPASNPMTSSNIIHQHLEQILKENLELKEALQQNNTTLRSHFQALTCWQEQQSKARSRHKQMFQDLQQTTASFQKDKEQLMEKCQRLETTCNDLKQEKEQAVSCLKENLLEKEKCIESLNEENERQKVFSLHLQQQLSENELEREKLEKKLNDIKREASVKSSSSSSSSQQQLVLSDEEFGYTVVNHAPSTTSSLSQKENEIERLDSTVQALQEGKSLLMKLLNDKDDDIKCLVEKQLKSEEEIAGLRSRLEILLGSAVIGPPSSPPPAQLSSSSSLDVAAAEQKWTLMERGIINTSNDFEAASICLEKYENRFSSVDQQLSQFQKRLQTKLVREEQEQREEERNYLLQELKEEIETLRMLLVSEQETKDRDKTNLEEARRKFNELHRDYKYLMKQWHDYQSEMQTKDRQMEYLGEIEKRKNQEELDEITAKLMSYEENVQEKECEIIRLKNGQDILKRETEQIPILRAQVELYQQELHRNKEERKTKESFIEGQKQEIRTLQSQVVQLMDEINHQSNDQLMEISGHSKGSTPPGPPAKASPQYQRRSSPSSSSSTSARQRSIERQEKSLSSGLVQRGGGGGVEEIDQVTECPRCKLCFVGLQAINNHVQICIFGNDDQNPFV